MKMYDEETQAQETEAREDPAETQETKPAQAEREPKSRRGAVGKIACPICHEKWHPRKHGSAASFREAHSKHDHGIGFAVMDEKEHNRGDLKPEALKQG